MYTMYVCMYACMVLHVNTDQLEYQDTNYRRGVAMNRARAPLLLLVRTSLSYRTKQCVQLHCIKTTVVE